MIDTTIFDCSLITLEKNHRDRGNLTVVESMRTLPMDIQRVYYLYDIPGGESRGAHAHKDLYQFLIAASGSFDVVLDDGRLKQTIHLNRPYQGLFIKPGIWRDIINFSSGAVCLVLASLKYDENDYIRSYKEFIDYKKNSSL